MTTALVIFCLVVQLVMFGYLLLTKATFKKPVEPDLVNIKKETEAKQEQLREELRAKIIDIKKASNKEMGDLLNRTGKPK